VRITSVDEVGAAEWDALAGDEGFYASHAWLRFVESRVPVEYAVAAAGGRVAAALPLYRVAHEPNAWYDPRRLAALVGADEPVVLAGSRAGYRSTLLAAGPDELAAALEEALASVAAPLVFPFLTSRALAELAAVAPVTATFDTVEAELAECGDGLDAYLARLGRDRRNKVRRELRVFRESGLRAGVRRLDECRRELAPLLANVQRRYDRPADAAVLAALLEAESATLAERSAVFTGEADGHLVAAFVAYRFGSGLFGRLAGFDYDRLPGAFEYFNLGVYEPVAYLAEHGLRSLHLGIGSWRAKAFRGATIEPLWTALVRTRGRPGVKLVHPERVAEWLERLEAGRHSFDPAAWRPDRG
jgi:uncharacterized protein